MANTAPARNIPMAAMNVHRNRSWPCPNGRSSLGSRALSPMETSRNAWFVVSASECAASASSAVEPLSSPPPSFATSISALAEMATSTVLRLAPASRCRPRLRLLTCWARPPAPCRWAASTMAGIPDGPRSDTHAAGKSQTMPQLVVGPLLRYVGETEAVIWVEPDRSCEVEVLGRRERTFCVCGHHYALVRCGGLSPGRWYEYQVSLDSEVVWPPDDGLPPSSFQTYPKQRPLEVVFGSCRVAAPHEPPWTLRKDDDPRGREIDALHTLVSRMRDQPRDEWPDVLFMIGDQVYADEVPPRTRSFIRERRDVDQPPGERVLDFDEYHQLYRESWTDPQIRWLLSTVSTAMIFDDHDVHDDWNISEAWLREMRRHEWWNRHILGALATYWVYQHLGNLAPGAHEDDELLARVKEAEDAEQILERFARQADRATSGTRWSYCRDLGRTRLVVVDSRAGRVLEEGHRSMLDDEEWTWVEQHISGDFDHLMVATSLPWLLGHGMHYVEAWSEAVAGGAWGSRLAPLGERVRRGADLEHWPPFHESFARPTELLRQVAAGGR